MCGIVGIVGKESVTQRLLDGLSRLEYRGYDSAGIALIPQDEIHSDDNNIEIRRSVGKLQELVKLVGNSPIEANIGIGHTRWATHGKATELNAHPHMNSRVAVVHNGIIENFASLKEKLVSTGAVFTSQTDTEVVPHLISYYLDQGKSPLEAFRATLSEIEGAFALAVLIKGQDDLILVARQGSPLVIGRGEGENMIGSDALTLSAWVKNVQYLEDGDYALISGDSVEIYDRQHHPVERKIQQTNLTGDSASKGTYDHFMLKEIFEQPAAIKNTLMSLIDADTASLKSDLNIDWATIPRLTIVACGTSYYAASVAKYWFEMLARLSVEIDIASEFRYRDPALPEGGAALFISQSGETIDTLMALNLAKEQGQKTIGLVNAPESSIARQADYVLYTQAGPEIGVASTKAFTAQLAVLACLAIEAGRDRGHLSPAQAKDMIAELLALPTEIYQVLQKELDFKKIAEQIMTAQDVLFLGRGTNYPIAMEGALKLKELSYIHAEGCPSGEIKHGPIALIDSKVPVVVVAPSDRWMAKTLSNMQEVIARGAQAICFTDAQGKLKLEADQVSSSIVEMPMTTSLTAPIVYTIPMQLLSYYTALLRGSDVDQPRNLAKSVTVE